MRWVYEIRVRFKRVLRLLPRPVCLWLQAHTTLMDSYCKECGRNVHDFVAPDEVWEKVEPLIKHGTVLCYDCFCEKCKAISVFPVWRLVPLEEGGDS